MGKRIAIIDEKLKDVFIKYFGGKDVEIVQFGELSEITECDLVALYDYNGNLPQKLLNTCLVLNLHPSLLPAFEGADSVRKAFSFGVKISGVTVINANNDKILAQYPVFMGLTMSFPEYCREINKACQNIYPRVAESVLNDIVFDFSDLLNAGCGGGCSGGCNKCSR